MPTDSMRARARKAFLQTDREDPINGIEAIAIELTAVRREALEEAVALEDSLGWVEADAIRALGADTEE